MHAKLQPRTRQNKTWTQKSKTWAEKNSKAPGLVQSLGNKQMWQTKSTKGVNPQVGHNGPHYPVHAIWNGLMARLTATSENCIVKFNVLAFS